MRYLARRAAGRCGLGALLPHRPASEAPRADAVCCTSGRSSSPGCRNGSSRSPIPSPATSPKPSRCCSTAASSRSIRGSASAASGTGMRGRLPFDDPDADRHAYGRRHAGASGSRSASCRCAASTTRSGGCACCTWWSRLERRELFLLNKLLTGEFRVGVAHTLVVRAVAHLASLPTAVVEHRLMGHWEPSAAAFAALVAPGGPGRRSVAAVSVLPGVAVRGRRSARSAAGMSGWSSGSGTAFAHSSMQRDG